MVAIEPFQRLRCWRRRQFLLLSPLVQCLIGLVGPWQDQIHAIHYDRIRYTCLFDHQSSLWRYDHDTGTGAERKLNATYVRAIQLCSSLIAAVIILISIMISTRRIDVSLLRTRIMLRFEWPWERAACVVAFGPCITYEMYDIYMYMFGWPAAGLSMRHVAMTTLPATLIGCALIARNRRFE